MPLFRVLAFPALSLCNGHDNRVDCTVTPRTSMSESAQPNACPLFFCSAMRPDEVLDTLAMPSKSLPSRLPPRPERPQQQIWPVSLFTVLVLSALPLSYGYYH